MPVKKRQGKPKQVKKNISPKKTQIPKKTLSSAKRQFVNVMASDVRPRYEGLPMVGLFGAIGPMVLSYAIKTGLNKYKNYSEAQAKKTLIEDTIIKVKKSAIFTKEPKKIQDIIVLFISDIKDPYAILGVKPTDSDMFIKYTYHKKRLFGSLPQIERDILDAAMAYIQINKSLLPKK